jgi:probable addiction module antidote protein
MPSVGNGWGLEKNLADFDLKLSFTEGNFGMASGLATIDDNGDFLDSGQTIEEYICAAFETEDPMSITRALGAVARASNMSQLARDIGMSRSALYRALSGDRNPEFATIVKVMKALGLKLRSGSHDCQAVEQDAA